MVVTCNILQFEWCQRPTSTLSTRKRSERDHSRVLTHLSIGPSESSMRQFEVPLKAILERIAGRNRTGISARIR